MTMTNERTMRKKHGGGKRKLVLKAVKENKL